MQRYPPHRPSASRPRTLHVEPAVESGREFVMAFVETSSGCASDSFERKTSLPGTPERAQAQSTGTDRKSTRLNSSHQIISYAVFCLKKKKTNYTDKIFMC